MPEITLFSKAGGPLTKVISLGPKGVLVSDGSACVMVKGKAERVLVADVHELAALIGKLKPYQAIALGALRPDLPNKLEIRTKDKINGVVQPGLIARTGSNIIYRGPAFGLFDFDSKGMPDAVATELERVGGFWSALVLVLPALADTAHVRRLSTSAGLYRGDTGKPLRGSDGVHVYVAIRDGGDAERFLRTLHDRAWLRGFGWFLISVSGALLERSIIDRMVGSAERLCFEGGPILKAPLKQDKTARRPVAVDGGVLDTAATCPPLSIVETSKLKDLKSKAAHELAPAAAKARGAFVDEQAKRLSKRTGMPAAAAKATILRQCDGILHPAIELPFDDPKLAGKTVADVLADPELYEGETLADPLEGVGYGKGVAKVLRRSDGVPLIHSFAHGGANYQLKRDAAAVRAGVEAAGKDKAVATFVRLAVDADLDAVALEELRQLAKQLSGVGLRAIDAALKAAREQHAEQRRQEAQLRRVALRRDPRPHIRAPFPDEPWLPQVDVLNSVIGGVTAAKPPSRDIDGVVARARKLPVPNLHAFTPSDVNVEETTNDQAAGAGAMGAATNE